VELFSLKKTVIPYACPEKSFGQPLVEKTMEGFFNGLLRVMNLKNPLPRKESRGALIYQLIEITLIYAA